MKINNIILKHPEQGYCKAALAIEQGRISKIEILGSLEEGLAAEFYVTPGFVNSHLHPNQLFDRRLLDELSISDLLDQMHADYKKTDQDRLAAAMFVLMEAIKSGATTAYAVASNPYPVIQAFNEFGLKGAVTCFYNDRWEGYGAPPAMALLELIEEAFLQAHRQQNERLAIHIGSASIESASNELLLLLDDLARRVSTKVNIHVSEGSDSVRSCLQSRQCSPVRLLSRLNVLNPRWNLIHAVSIDAEEIELIAKSGASVIHCPVSNAKTGLGIAPILELARRNVNIGLGTDACSNNNTNNILNEAYFCSLLHAAFSLDAKALPVETLMQWLTQQGHEILGTGQKGCICVGEPADLLLWSLQDNAFVPLSYGKFDAALIYNAPDLKPHTVLIDGKRVVENYRCILFPEQEIRDAANACSMKITHFCGGAV